MAFRNGDLLALDAHAVNHLTLNIVGTCLPRQTAHRR